MHSSLSVFIYFARSELTKEGGPPVVICTHSGIEVTQNNNLFLAGNVPDDGCKVLVEHVFCVWCGSVGAYTLIRVTGLMVELRRTVLGHTR